MWNKIGFILNYARDDSSLTEIASSVGLIVLIVKERD